MPTLRSPLRSPLRSSIFNPTNGRWGNNPPTVIIDTDFAGDCDDPIAISVALSAHKIGLIRIVGFIVSSTVVTSAPGLYGMLKAYGFQSIPIYAYQGATGSYNNVYSGPLRDRFGVAAQTRTAYTDDLTGYRTLVAANPGVTLIGIGAPICLSRFLSSAADGISPLTGAQLIAANVKKSVQMAGNFPTGTAEYNASRDPASTQNVATNWPSTVPFWWTGAEEGNTVWSMPSLDADPLLDPVRYAFDLSLSLLTGGRRPSWDPMAVLAAIFGVGTGTIWQVGGANGSVAVDGTGITTWSATTGPHSYLTKLAADADIAFLLDAYTAGMQLPVQTPSPSFYMPLTEGAGETVQSNNSTIQGALGFLKLSETGVQPGWTDLGTPVGSWVLNWPNVGRLITLPVDLSENANANIIGGVVAMMAATTANQTLMAMYDLGASGQFILRSTSSAHMQLLVFKDLLLNNDQYNSTGTDIVASAWAMWTFQILNGTVTLRKNGTNLLSTALLNPMIRPPKRCRIQVGARITGTPGVTDNFLGQVAAFGFKSGAQSGDLATLETSLQASATAKGITLS